MTQLKNLIPEHLLQQMPKNSDWDILTEEEKLHAMKSGLDQASKTKLVAIKTEEYRKKIFEKKAPVSVPTEQFKEWIFKKAKNEIKDFKVESDAEKRIYRMLCQYFNNDIEFEKEVDQFGGNYSLDKGIWLHGGVGCGKTNLMKLFRENPTVPYGVVESIKVADMYKDKDIGVDVIEKYAHAESICFDDFGTEIENGESSHFGNRKNVIGEIILRHYSLNEKKRFRFHFTTNLGASLVEKEYGVRVRSRIREMCNLISLEGIADKRK
jgi:hypothetical protein